MERSKLLSNKRERGSVSLQNNQKLESNIIKIDLQIHKIKKYLMYLNSLSEKDFRKRKKEQLLKEIEQLEVSKERLLDALLRIQPGLA